MQEAMDVMKHSPTTTRNTSLARSAATVVHLHPPNIQLSNQMQITITRTRLNVTTFLYTSPNTSASSLSTLIAVDVKMDSVVKIKPKTLFTCSLKYERLVLMITDVIIACTTRSGCKIRPVRRSVTARETNKIFVGGEIEVTLQRATRIKTLPMHAVIEEKAFRAILMAANFSGLGDGNISENSAFLSSSLLKFDMTSYVGQRSARKNVPLQT